MMLHEAVVARLAAVPAVVELVADRVYPKILPQPPTYPAVAYTRVSRVEGFTADGPDGLVEIRLQLDAYAETYDESVELAAALRAALNGWRALVYGVHKTESVPGSERDLWEDEVQAHRVTADFLVQGTEN